MVPVLTRAGTNNRFLTISLPLDTRYRNLNHQPRKTRVRDEKVRTPSQNEDRELPVFRELNRVDDGFFRGRFDQVPCRAANAERCQWRKRHILLDECFHRGFSLTLWP